VRLYNKTLSKACELKSGCLAKAYGNNKTLTHPDSQEVKATVCKIVNIGSNPIQEYMPYGRTFKSRQTIKCNLLLYISFGMEPLVIAEHLVG
jgi:hypothetical protein